MPIWDGATTVVLERSSAGNTATVLGAGDAVLATCDDAGTVTGPDGAPILTAAFSWPRERRSRPDEARVDVAAADGSPAGHIGIRRFSFGPFSKKLELALFDASDTQVGELATTDKKARQFVVKCGDATVATLDQADRDRSLARTVERWTLQAENRPGGAAELLAAAAILRFNKVLAEVGSQPTT